MVVGQVLAHPINPAFIFRVISEARTTCKSDFAGKTECAIAN